MTSCCKPCNTQSRMALSIIPISPGSPGIFLRRLIMSGTVVNTQKQTPADERRRENLYHAKLQCLAVILGKEAYLDKQFAERSADAVNAAFDKITF